MREELGEEKQEGFGGLVVSCAGEVGAVCEHAVDPVERAGELGAASAE